MQVVLVYFKDDGERKDIHLPSGRVVVGREKGCDLRIPIPSVSRKHCELRQEDDSLVVKDLGSSNGTYRNGKRIEDEEQVEAGDQIAVGALILTVQIDGDPEHVEPPLLEAPAGASPDDTGPDDLRTDDSGGGTDASDDSDDISDLIKRASEAVGDDDDDSDVFNIDLGLDDDD